MENLIGTEKQISWANDIITNAIEHLQKRVEKLSGKPGKEEIVEEVKKRIQFIQTEITSASFVIAYRDNIARVGTEEWEKTETLRNDMKGF